MILTAQSESDQVVGEEGGRGDPFSKFGQLAGRSALRIGQIKLANAGVGLRIVIRNAVQHLIFKGIFQAHAPEFPEFVRTHSILSRECKTKENGQGKE